MGPRQRRVRHEREMGPGLPRRKIGYGIGPDAHVSPNGPGSPAANGGGSDYARDSTVRSVARSNVAGGNIAGRNIGGQNIGGLDTAVAVAPVPTRYFHKVDVI